MVYTYSIVLNDAYYFLNQCKGLPEIPSSELLRQRHLRACVLFSWIAVEEMLHDSAIDLKRRGVLQTMPNGKLSKRVNEILLLRGTEPLNVVEFRAMRQLRNILAHPVMSTSPEVSVTVEQARNVFDYCLGLVRSLAPHKLILEPFTVTLLPERGTREGPLPNDQR